MDYRQKSIRLSCILYQFTRMGIRASEEISPGEFALLMQLHTTEEKQKLIGELASAMNTTQPAISQMVKRMESRDLVKRELDQNDKRNVHVYPTEKGTNAFQTVYEHSLSFTDKVLEEMGEDQSRKLVELLEEFYAVAGKIKDR